MRLILSYSHVYVEHKHISITNVLSFFYKQIITTEYQSDAIYVYIIIILIHGYPDNI